MDIRVVLVSVIGLCHMCVHGGDGVETSSKAVGEG